MAIDLASAGWLLSNAYGAYKEREEIIALGSRLARMLRGDHRVAVTGISGAGKSTLIEHLSDVAWSANYKPPGVSTGVESVKVEGKARDMLLTAIPGQDSPKRQDALDDAFDGKKPVNGVIHVVSNGYSRLQSSAGGEVLEAHGKSLAEFRKKNIEIELDDARETFARICNAHRKWQKPTWVVIAVDKIDLYMDQLETAYEYYEFGRGGLFSDVLDKAVAKAGSNNITIRVVPLAVFPSDFVYGGERVESRMNIEDRNAYLNRFVGHVLECANV